MIYKSLAAAALAVLAFLLIMQGMRADILPPVYTGIGFLVIGAVYVLDALNGKQ